jgi:hypothetical protein
MLGVNSALKRSERHADAIAFCILLLPRIDITKLKINQKPEGHDTIATHPTHRLDCRYPKSTRGHHEDSSRNQARGGLCRESASQ